MSAATSKDQLDLRALGDARRAAETARRERLLTYAADGRTPTPSLPIAQTATPQIQPSKRWRWRQPRVLIHPFTLGIAAGVVAVFAIASIVPHLGAKTNVPIVPAAHAASVTMPAPTAKPTAAIIAKPADRLQIAALGVNAPVMTVGLLNGALDTPKTLWQVARYKASVAAGDNGTTIVVGHSGAPGQVGVFEHLSRLKTGDIITYKYVDGRMVTYRVLTSAAYPNSPAGATVLFANTATPSLNLVSCYGHWDAGSQTYAQRWIVTAALVSS